MLTNPKLELTHSFELLSSALTNFNQLLLCSHLPLWLPSSDSQVNHDKMRESAAELFRNIWHNGDGDGRLTINCHGVIGASSELISSAKKLNESKDRFKQAISQLKDKDPKAINLALQSRSNYLAAAMHNEGLSRLHLKQCYRHIPILSKGCTKVQFSWYSSGKSIKRISQQQCLQMLLQLDQASTHIQAQINKVSNLRPGTRLAQVQTQVPIMRANAVWPIDNKDENTTSQQWLRKARNAPLPLLLPLEPNETLPEFNRPSINAPVHRTRSTRSDSIIEPSALLPSLRVHCYKS